MRGSSIPPLIKGGLIEASYIEKKYGLNAWHIPPLIKGGLIEALSGFVLSVNSYYIPPLIKGGLIEAVRSMRLRALNSSFRP